jgi:hypothetical protein
MIIVFTEIKLIYMQGEINMFKILIYDYYYKKFMKENKKDEKDINWEEWSRLDRICEILYK